QLSVGSRNYRAQSGRLVEEFVPTLPAADSPNFGASLMASMRSGPRLGNAASAEYTDSLLGSLRYELELCLRAIDAGTAKATSALQHGGRRPEPDLGVDPDCHGDPAYNIPPERGLQLVGDWLRETLPNIAIADAPE
ncbi:MAG TPA: hypothetical protein VGE52_12550, partial [Pirellulales bacterium]